MFHAANRAPHRVRGPTRHFLKSNSQEIHMKRLALVAAVLAVAACSTKETPKADTAAPAMAPAPAMGSDTAMKMDSTARDTSAAAKMDTAMKKVDTAAKKLDEAKDAVKAAKP
jgi:cell division protein ZapA (FtsZ GTPase activity inhibitor)